MNPAASSSPTRITFFPDYRPTNPYQTLLYESLEPEYRADPGTIADALELCRASPDRPHLFHLHWEHAVFTGAGEPRVVERFLDDMARFREAGGRVIWTIHNLAPHDELKNKANEDLQSGLLRLADILHLHSLPALVAARSELPLPERKVRVIAHANYEGAYPVFPRNSAREELGLPAEGRIVLCPGRIAPYKQPEKLIEAFLASAGLSDRLIIAGETARDFTFTLPADDRLVHRNGFASPEMVGKLHAAADFVVLPYRASLTSGSAILAATLGRAVVGPDTPGLRDVVAPPLTGLIYPSKGLADTLRTALEEDADTWAECGRAAAELAGARNRTAIAAIWHDILTALLSPAFKRLGETS